MAVDLPGMADDARKRYEIARMTQPAHDDKQNFEHRETETSKIVNPYDDTPEPMTVEQTVANWTAERMRKMHYPIKEGKFMEGGLTPHQWMTREIVELIERAVAEALEDLTHHKKSYARPGSKPIEWTAAVPLNSIKDRIAQLKNK